MGLLGKPTIFGNIHILYNRPMDPLWDLGWVLGFGRVILVFFGWFDALFQRKFEDLQLRVLSPCKHREIETERRAVRETGE